MRALACIFFLFVCLSYKMIDVIRSWNAIFDNEQPLLYPISIWRMNLRMAILLGTHEHKMKSIITRQYKITCHRISYA